MKRKDKNTMSKAIDLKEPGGSILLVTAAREAATTGAESNAELAARWVQRFRKPGRTEAEAVRLAEAEAHRVAEATIGQAAPAAEAGEPEADAAVKARAGWVRRFLNQGKSTAEAERLADLTFSPNTRKRFFSGAAPKAADPGRKPFFTGATKTDLTEGGR
jgi:hypothetical protein